MLTDDPEDEDLTRDELEEMLVQKAVADGDFWNLLVNNPRAALREFFGKEPPPDLQVETKVEDASVFYHVVSHPDYVSEGVGPPTLTPRSNFSDRLNYLIHSDPQFREQFEQNPQSAVANALNFRFPQDVRLQPLVETESSVYLVLPHAPHNAMFNAPYAVEFDGQTGYVEAPWSPSLMILNALTVEAWFSARHYNPSAWYDPVVSTYDSAGGWELRVGGATPRFMVTINGVQYYAQPDDPVPFLKPSTWYYLVGVYDGTKLQLYLNGELKYTTAISGQLTQNEGRLTLGRAIKLPEQRYRFFHGLIDEVRVWGETALSVEQIRQHRPRKQRAPLSQTATLRAYYPMSEGTGDVLHDHSPYHNDGRMVNARWVSTGVGAP